MQTLVDISLQFALQSEIYKLFILAHTLRPVSLRVGKLGHNITQNRLHIGKNTRAKPKKLLDQVWDVLRVKHYSYRTEKTYIFWIRRYIFFQGKKHPVEMGAQQIQEFLTHLAVDRSVAA